MTLLVLNGPNLNLLGSREVDVYGNKTLDQLNKELVAIAKTAGHELVCHQFNAEHLLIEAIHQAPSQGVQYIIINPAAFGHTSIALRDALLGVGLPFCEVHISNIYAREEFRQHSLLADVASGVIVGLGTLGYSLALRAAIEFVEKK